MPIYEYECTACGQLMEVIQKFSDKPIQECRHCSGKVQKRISQSSFHLKGSGWYVTDYAKRSTSGTASPNQAKDAASASETKTTANEPVKTATE